MLQGEQSLALAFQYFPFQVSLLQNSHCRGDFSRLEATAEDAGGHFWHDAVIETNIITPAQWILPNRNRSCNGGT
jgi:hypothetical protein